MKTLPKGPHKFLYWWAVLAPKKIVQIISRIIKIVNSNLSFTLNIKLLFTPLFGDYSIVGRFVGFIFRIVEIVIGIVIIGVLLVLMALGPILWYLMPLIFFDLYRFWILPLGIVFYLLWAFLSRNMPDAHIKSVKENSFEDAIRPEILPCYNKIKSDFNLGIKEAFNQKEILEFAERAEMNVPQFMEKIQQINHIEKELFEKTIFRYASELGTRYIEPEIIFISAIFSIPKYDVLLSGLGLKPQTLESTAKWILDQREKRESIYIWADEFSGVRTGGFGKGMTGRVTPFLDSISFDFTKDAKFKDYTRYSVREPQIKRIAELLMNSKDNILIIGEPGSGKTSLVRGMAHKILEGNEYNSLSNKRIVGLELGGIFGGTAGVGALSDKLKWAFEEAKGSRDILIFIDEIHNLVAGNDQTPEVAAIYSILQPYLESGGIQFIAATNMQNYRKYIEPNGAFARLFNIVEIPEATSEETMKILVYEANDLERKYNLKVTYPALEKSIELSKKLIHERVLPDKAIIILQRTATRIPKGDKLLDSENVAKEISEMTNVPVSAVTQDEAQKLITIEDEMRNMVIGQDHALKQVAASIKRARVGIRDENKPIASFLFVGTTGVGKTQTARALAKSYFGDPKSMIRLDMSEYQQIDSITRLIGSPDGKSQGLLTNSVRAKPFSLLLLDEIEKAHPNILMLFLQVLDEGQITDATGLKIDFTNTIIIATSNVGTRTIQSMFNQNASYEEMKEAAMSDVRSHFSPEFLNRFSGIIVYNPLSIENIRKITRMLLENVKKTTDAKNIKINFTDELVEEIIKRGYNPEWGARPLSRVIEENVETYIAERILAKELNQGDETEIGAEVFS